MVAPAPGLSDRLATQAQELALRIARELDVTGILAVELFETDDDRILVNELAMRPHNTGHWSRTARSPRSSRTTSARCSTYRSARR